MRLPKAFFDTNTAGRILNRFSRDTEVMDTVLSQSMIQFVNCFVTYISILIVISVATKWFAIAILPITVVYILVQVRGRAGGHARWRLAVGWGRLQAVGCSRVTSSPPATDDSRHHRLSLTPSSHLN
jgi:ABC-type multidrug transport system fused ATPase/permease subunit